MERVKTSKISSQFAFLKALGPGLLWAGAAIGVSHLVQATRAGADFGFTLMWEVILIHILKYPFFEYGPRYASVRGESLLDGYLRISPWALMLFLIITVVSMFTVVSTVTIVTAEILHVILPFNVSLLAAAIGLIIVCGLILAIGHYHLLDQVIKVVIVTLVAAVLFSLICSIQMNKASFSQLTTHFSWLNKTNMIFLVALLGWMPSPLDLSVWHSLWSVAKQQDLQNNSKKYALLDFNIGYIGTAILAVCFLSLGALVMFGSNMTFSNKGTIFVEQLITLFAENIGQWAYPGIAIAAFAAMFSTTITCLDAYSRVLRRSTCLLMKVDLSSFKLRMVYWFWLLIISVGALLIIGKFQQNLFFLVTIATILSFLTAPILGALNFYLVTSRHMPKHAVPKLWLKILSWIGLIVLTLISLWFFYLQLVN